MKTDRQFSILLFAFIAVCLFSLPVHSGDHPWDPDDGGNDGNVIDSTVVIRPDDFGTDPTFDLASSPGSFSDLIFHLSFKITTWYFDSGRMNSQKLDGNRVFKREIKQSHGVLQRKER